MGRYHLSALEITACILLCAVSRLSAVRESGACVAKIAGICSRNEFSCSNGNCIDRELYCDGGDNCGDNSDETYCNYRRRFSRCPEDPPFAACESYKCIPKGWICNGYSDCTTGEDERHCGVIQVSQNPTAYEISSARKRAIKWLQSYSSSDIATGKWGSLASKAAVALFLAATEQLTSNLLLNGTSSPKDLSDGLSIQLLSRLAHKRMHDISSTDLSSFVNGLLVTCVDPRQFYGMNLVEELRLRVNSQNYTNPYDLLTLCNAGETITDADEKKLTQAFQSNYREFWTDVKSIAILALVCANNQPGNSIDSELLKELTTELKNLQYRNGTVENLQTTALVMQALYAAEPDEDTENFDEGKALQQILLSQKPDGSFGSLIKTYYVLPVLNCKSLVNISSSHCEVKQKDESTAMQNLMNQGGSKVRIQYSLWIGDDKDIERIIALKVPTNSSFYRIIELAADIDNGFRFEYAMKNRKPYINGISGILDDPEGGKFWFPYKIEGSKPTLILTSPANVIPKENDHLVMWYRSGSWVNRNSNKV